METYQLVSVIQIAVAPYLAASAGFLFIRQGACRWLMSRIGQKWHAVGRIWKVLKCICLISQCWDIKLNKHQNVNNKQYDKSVCDGKCQCFSWPVNLVLLLISSAVHSVVISHWSSCAFKVGFCFFCFLFCSIDCVMYYINPSNDVLNEIGIYIVDLSWNVYQTYMRLT